jgi:hypothetical protein
MSAPDDQFDFATLLRREAAPDQRAHSADDDDLAPAVSDQSLQPDGSERKAAADRADWPPLSRRVPRPVDASSGNAAALTRTLAVVHRWRPSFRLPRAPDSPLFGIVSGAAAFILIAGAIIVSLVHHLLPNPSDSHFALSGASTLASMKPQPVEPPAAPAPESAPAASPSNAIAPASFRDTVDPETKAQRSSEAKTPESAVIVPASVKTLVSSEIAPSEPPKLVSMYSRSVTAQPFSTPPVPAVPPTAQQGPPPPRPATETTASISPSTPSSDAKADGAHAEATPPHIDDASRRKRDQRPGKTETPVSPVPSAAQRSALPSRAAAETTASISPTAPSSETKTAAVQPAAQTDDASRRKRDQKAESAVEASSCTGGVFPGYVRASARAKPGQVDVQKMCADPHAPFSVSVRCLVASVVCSDYPAERQGRVAQKAATSSRAPSHTVTDTKPEAKLDAKPDAKSH